MTPSSVKVQISPESVPSTPSWLGEATLIAHVFAQRGLLSAIVERVRFARARFGTYDTIDFVVVLLGYAVSGERTLEEYYERLKPFGQVFMSLFERADLPSHSALSRYLAALDQPAVEAWRTLFLEDLGACRELAQGGLYDREGTRWVIIDVDARSSGRTTTGSASWLCVACRPSSDGCGVCTRLPRTQTRRSRANPNHGAPSAHAELAGHVWGGGNGDYRGELLRAIEAIKSLAQAWSIPLSRILIRLDGLYGNVALLIDLLTSGLGVVVRGRDYTFLDLPSGRSASGLTPGRVDHPSRERCSSRSLVTRPGIPLTPTGIVVRMIVAVHQASAIPAPIGVTKNGLVYEIFFTSAPKEAFTPGDVLHLASPIEAHLRRYWHTRIWSRTRTDGFLIPHWDRNAGRSSPNGSGTGVWNWDSTSNRSICA